MLELSLESKNNYIYEQKPLDGLATVWGPQSEIVEEALSFLDDMIVVETLKESPQLTNNDDALLGVIVAEFEKLGKSGLIKKWKHKLPLEYIRALEKEL